MVFPTYKCIGCNTVQSFLVYKLQYIDKTYLYSIMVHLVTFMEYHRKQISSV